MMQLVRCISIRENVPTQIKPGKFYWLDDSSVFVDNDTVEFAEIYADSEGKHSVGLLNTAHFVRDSQYVK